MNSLAQTAQSTTPSSRSRWRRVGWSTITSGVALIIAGEAAFIPSAYAWLAFIATLVLYLAMIPLALWLYSNVAAQAPDTRRLAQTAEIIGVAGMLVAAAVAVLDVVGLASVATNQVISLSAVGAIGVWLIIANAQAFRARLINRVLAVLGVLIGIGWLLNAVGMWIELTISALGSLVPTLETIRTAGAEIGQAIYLIWALWLGIWLLVRKR